MIYIFHCADIHLPAMVVTLQNNAVHFTVMNILPTKALEHEKPY